MSITTRQRKWVDWDNAKTFKKAKDYEAGGGVSKTIPDQTKSLKEIVDRFARGLPITGNPNPPQFQDINDPNPLPDFERMDLSEIHAMAKANAQEINRLRKEQAERESAEAQEKHKEWMLSEFKKWKEQEEQSIQSLKK